MARRGTKTTTVATRLSDDALGHLMALAYRLNADASEIMRRLVVNGLDVNPVTDEEKRTALTRLREKARGELKGLVLPLSPLAARENARDGATSSDEKKEWRGERDSNP